MGGGGLRWLNGKGWGNFFSHELHEFALILLVLIRVIRGK